MTGFQKLCVSGTEIQELSGRKTRVFVEWYGWGNDTGERALERKMPDDAVLVGWLST